MNIDIVKYNISQLAPLLIINAILILGLFFLVYVWNPTSDRKTSTITNNSIVSLYKSIEPPTTPPIKSFSALVNRPLFAHNRKPQKKKEAIMLQPIYSESLSITIDDEANNDDWLLIGTILTGTTKIAIVQNSNDSTVIRAKLHGTIGGWDVRSINPKEVVIESAGISKTLQLIKIDNTDLSSQPLTDEEVFENEMVPAINQTPEDY